LKIISIVKYILQMSNKSELKNVEKTKLKTEAIIQMHYNKD